MSKLEDLEDIRQLKALYAERVDNNHRNPSHATAVLATALFTDDAVLDPGSGVRYTGRAAILNAFENIFPAQTAWSTHYIVNPVIDVTGSTATGRWYVLLYTQPNTTPSSSVFQVFGIYTEKYEKGLTGWRFKEVIATITPPKP